MSRTNDKTLKEALEQMLKAYKLKTSMTKLLQLAHGRKLSVKPLLTEPRKFTFLTKSYLYV